MTDKLVLRDALLASAVAHCRQMSGKRQDIAIFDHLAGACAALHTAGLLDHPVPPFLFVIAVRGGDRFKECERMLAESTNAAPAADTAAAVPPVKK